MSAPEKTPVAVGDLMVVRDGGYNVTRTLAPVARITKTLIAVKWGDRERRFVARSMRELGADGWLAPSITPATPDLIAEVREERQRAQLVARIRQTVWHKLTTAQLVAVVTALGPENREVQS